MWAPPPPRHLRALRRGAGVTLALGSAAATAGYTLTDGLGARVWGEPVAYVAWLMILAALFYTPAVLALKGRAVLRADGRAWLLGLAAAAASFLAYAIAVWAMTRAPIPLVGALRETSILFAVLIGWLAFGERMDRGKILAAVLIVAGVALTRL
jgi:drug/metabolite transporter (DMT)-like permease